MDTRADFQRLLDDMDRAIKRKREELAELDEQLDLSRKQVSEREIKELALDDSAAQDIEQRAIDNYVREQQAYYEKHVASLTQEILDVEATNAELTREVQRLSSERDAFMTTNKKLDAKLHLLSENYNEIRHANFELNMRLAKAESESNLQHKLLRKTHDQDQVLIEAFNDKLDSMRQTITAKDEEIRSLRLGNQITLESLGVCLDLGPNGMGMEKTTEVDMANQSKTRVIEIASLVRSKDERIALLEQQLAQATNDLESSAKLLEGLTKVKAVESELSAKTKAEESKCIDDPNIRYLMLENELEAKDNELHVMKSRIKHLELIIPHNISSLIDDLRSHVSRSSAENQSEVTNLDKIRIADLTTGLARLLAQLVKSKSLLDRNEQLERIIVAKDKQIQRLVRELNELDERISRDNGEHPDDKEKPVHKECQQRDEPSIVTSTLIRDQDLNNNVACQISSSGETGIEQDDQPLEEARDQQDLIEPVATKKQSAELKIIPFSCKRLISIEKEERANKELRSRVMELDEENQLLESAMKEILISIRTSDIDSDIMIIDCPSLERLCQLIEAKYITNAKLCNWLAQEDSPNTKEPNLDDSAKRNGYNLFQLIVMKSELDLLRGQNEQLRAELKIQRREFFDSVAAKAVAESETKPPNEATGVEEDPKCVEDRANEQQEQAQSANISSVIIPKQPAIDEMDASNQDDEPVDVEQNSEDYVNTSQPEPEKDENCVSLAKTKCQNCSRLIKLALHLLECIERIEARVNSSDEIYISRLLSLYHLSQQLGKDLAEREMLLGRLRIDYHALQHQKRITESERKSIENQLTVHLKICPLYNSVSAARSSTSIVH